MFEITRIRFRRAYKLALYSLAIYGALTLTKGCREESNISAEISQHLKSYFSSELEKRVDNLEERYTVSKS